jgi:peptidoglycan-associated lipoprotein
VKAKKTSYWAAVVIILLFGLSLFSCKGKEIKRQETAISVPPTAETSTGKTKKQPNITGQESAGQLRERTLKEEEAKRLKEEAEKAQFESEDIHFDFDRYLLSDTAKQILDKKAQWLENHSSAKILIEGRCDERGSEEYNLALGQKRADAAMQYLVSLGINENRISTISYGKEKPVDPGHNEEAWAKNRCDRFVLK